MPEHRDLFSLAAGFRRADARRRQLTPEAIRGVLAEAAAMAIETIPKDGIGRRIWGKKNSGLKKLVKAGEVVAVGDDFQGTVNVNGLAGLTEQGGRTKKHEIKGKGRFLARRAGENHGRVFFVKLTPFIGPRQKGKKRPKSGTVVLHPGGPVAAKHRVADAIRDVSPKMVHRLEEVLDRSMEAANG